MKKTILFLMLSLGISNLCFSQDWLTSLDVAKRVALIQNKFLLMVWDDAVFIPYPVMINDDGGRTVLIEDIFAYDEITEIFWDYFVPVIVNESVYDDLYEGLKKTRSLGYMDQFSDDNIKIMDANFNIVNRSIVLEPYSNLSEFIRKYALNTTFITPELRNYTLQKNFVTAYQLASKYLDYAVMVNSDVREDIITISDLYLDDADRFLPTVEAEKKSDYELKSRLLRLSKYLVQNKSGRVQRQLKRMKLSEADVSNQSLVPFLYYTSYRLQGDAKNAELWSDKVSAADIKKSAAIVKLHR